MRNLIVIKTTSYSTLLSSKQVGRIISYSLLMLNLIIILGSINPAFLKDALTSGPVSICNLFILYGLLYRNQTIIASILFGIIIIYKGYCRHKRLQSSILFGIGALFWVMHTVFEDHRFILSISYLLIGTACVCGSYYLNHRHIKCCQPASCD